jgi:hypothetical protein
LGNRINVRWDDSAKQVILVTYPDGWNWVEFKQAGDNAEALLAEVPHDVDIIHYVTGAIPTNTLSQIPEIARTSPSLINPQIRYAIVVGTSRYLEIAYRMFRTIYPQLTERLLMCETIDAAHDLIAEKRAEAL